MNRAQLLDGLAQDILAYVMHGNFPEAELASRLKLEGLDQRFDEYELLLDLHFILDEEVVAFVRRLPERLRSIRTESQSVSELRRGEVRGRIDWAATAKQRYRTNPRDPSTFVCEDHATNYDIPENLVVKSLLGTIHRTLQDAGEYLHGDYEWVQETWKGNESLIEELQEIVERNVHVRRIREPTVGEPTDRMIHQAAEARQAVYREAARLVDRRRRLHRGEEKAIRGLLERTAITPDDMSTLYELYVLFTMVGTLEDLLETNPEFRTIASARQELVRLDGPTEVVVYHDTAAGDRDLSFTADLGAGTSRSDRVQATAFDVAQTYFTDTTFRHHTGRPDVLIVQVRNRKTGEEAYLITEVKYSSNVKTVRRGIKETLEYLAFLRKGKEFVFGEESDAPFGDGWNGLLVTLDLEEETQSLAEQTATGNPVKILEASELSTGLARVLEEVIGESSGRE